MENLNKENFWNELHAKYPTAVNHFCKWIDAYKEEVGWKKLFADGVKFHDIPFDMQNGIIARFEIEMYNNKLGEGKRESEKIRNDYKKVVENLFKDLQNSIDKRGKTLN